MHYRPGPCARDSAFFHSLFEPASLYPSLSRSLLPSLAPAPHRTSGVRPRVYGVRARVTTINIESGGRPCRALSPNRRGQSRAVALALGGHALNRSPPRQPRGETAAHWLTAVMSFFAAELSRAAVSGRLLEGKHLTVVFSSKVGMIRSPGAHGFSTKPQLRICPKCLVVKADLMVLAPRLPEAQAGDQVREGAGRIRSDLIANLGCKSQQPLEEVDVRLGKDSPNSRGRSRQSPLPTAPCARREAREGEGWALPR